MFEFILKFLGFDCGILLNQIKYCDIVEITSENKISVIYSRNRLWKLNKACCYSYNACGVKQVLKEFKQKLNLLLKNMKCRLQKCFIFAKTFLQVIDCFSQGDSLDAGLFDVLTVWYLWWKPIPACLTCWYNIREKEKQNTALTAVTVKILILMFTEIESLNNI